MAKIYDTIAGQVLRRNKAGKTRSYAEAFPEDNDAQPQLAEKKMKLTPEFSLSEMNSVLKAAGTMLHHVQPKNRDKAILAA
jgi:hypothetical protein